MSSLSPLKQQALKLFQSSPAVSINFLMSILLSETFPTMTSFFILSKSCGVTYGF